MDNGKRVDRNGKFFLTSKPNFPKILYKIQSTCDREEQMKKVRYLILGLVIGAIIGLWFGINIGEDKSIFSNPFSEPTIQKKLKQTGGEVLEKGGKALEKSGKALKKKMAE